MQGALRKGPRSQCRNLNVMPTYQHNRVVETATESRAGETGHHVRYVLSAGVVGVIALFAIVYLYYFV